jgi:hypothetical protein
MSDALSFTELQEQHVELLPDRTVMQGLLDDILAFVTGGLNPILGGVETGIGKLLGGL